MSFFVRNKLSLMVCDMGGTIINEQGLVYSSLCKVLDNMGYEVNTKDVESWKGMDKREVLYNHINKIENHMIYDNYKETLKRVNEAENNLLLRLEKEYFKKNNIELIDDKLLDLFDGCRINGVKVALNTGYPKEFQERIIDYFNLGERIDTYISSEEVKMGRPYPYMIHNLMERCDIPSVKNVVKIGDTSKDMLEGKNAGCGLTIGVLSGGTNKERLVKDGDLIINKITDLRNDNDVPVFLL